MGTKGIDAPHTSLCTHSPASGFQNVFAHTAWARLKGAITTQLCLAGPLADCLSLPFSFFLSADNMVDQTKVETSQAKANELEKKVKDLEMFSCNAHINMYGPCTRTYYFSHFSHFKRAHLKCHLTFRPTGIVIKFNVTSESC